MLLKKSLGQNFLKTASILSDIIEAGEVSATDIVLEIGPGDGALTTLLVQKAKKVICIEKDHRLIPVLQEKFARVIAEGKLELLHADVLDTDPEQFGLQPREYKLIANIPYYITGELLRKYTETSAIPSLIVVMVQKEVAMRVAKSEKESILSLSMKVYGLPEYVKTVKAGNFFPVPNVDSAILKLSGINKDFFSTNHIKETDFFDIVKAGFAHKRKFLAKNLENVCLSEKITKAFEELGLSPKSRAEELDLTTWKELIKKLSAV